jgi:hypothetical protein
LNADAEAEILDDSVTGAWTWAGAELLKIEDSVGLGKDDG